MVPRSAWLTATALVCVASCASAFTMDKATISKFAKDPKSTLKSLLGIPTGSLSNCSTDPTVMFFALASLDHNCRSLEVDMSGDKNGAPADCSKPACKSALKKLNNKCRHLLPTTGNSATEKNADYILNCTSTKSGCTGASGLRTTFLKECFTNSARSKLGWSSSSSFQPTPVRWMMDPNATEALLDLACHKQTGQNCRAAMKKYGDTCDDTTVTIAAEASAAKQMAAQTKFQTNGSCAAHTALKNLTKAGKNPDKLAIDAAGALYADGDKTGKQLKDAADNATKVLNASVHKMINDKLNPNVTSDKGKLATLATNVIDSNLVSRYVANDVLGKKSSDAGSAAVNFTHVAAQNSYSLPNALMNAKTAQGQADVKKSAKDLLDSNFVTREIIKAGGGTVTSVADGIGGTVAPIGANGYAATDDKNTLRQAVNTTAKGLVNKFADFNTNAKKVGIGVKVGTAVKDTSAYLTTQMRDKWASQIKGLPKGMQTADVAKAVDDTVASKTVGAVLGQVDTTDLLEVNQKGDWMINQKSKAVTSVTTGDGKQATSTAQSVADGVVGDVGTSGIQGDIATTAQKLVKYPVKILETVPSLIKAINASNVKQTNAAVSPMFKDMEKDKLGGAQLIAVGKAAETAETEGLKLAKSGSGGKASAVSVVQKTATDAGMGMMTAATKDSKFADDLKHDMELLQNASKYAALSNSSEKEKYLKSNPNFNKSYSLSLAAVEYEGMTTSEQTTYKNTAAAKQLGFASYLQETAAQSARLETAVKAVQANTTAIKALNNTIATAQYTVKNETEKKKFLVANPDFAKSSNMAAAKEISESTSAVGTAVESIASATPAPSPVGAGGGDGSGDNKFLIIGIVAVVVLLIAGGVGFIATRGDGEMKADGVVAMER